MFESNESRELTDAELDGVVGGMAVVPYIPGAVASLKLALGQKRLERRLDRLKSLRDRVPVPAK